MAGEIGIEPMASCASDRRSTRAELLADVEVLSGPGRSRTDRLRIASAVLSRTELQAQGPGSVRQPGIQLRSNRRQLVRTSNADRLFPKTSSPNAKERPASGPSRSSRTNPVRRLSTQELRGCEQRRSQRPTAACWAFIKGRWRCGSIVATLTRPASLHYSVVVQVLGGG